MSTDNLARFLARKFVLLEFSFEVSHENSFCSLRLLYYQKPVAIIKHKHSVQESKWEFILGQIKAFWKLSIEANDLVKKKLQTAFQKRAVFAVMPTKYS